MYEELGPRGFTVLGFPSNDFADEEPGTNAEIKEFARRNYGATFPLFAKAPVTGQAAAPLYKHLAGKFAPPRWNFHKYLVDAGGEAVAAFDAKLAPDAPDLRLAIERLLDG